jgi:hypothetical protein
MGSLIRKFETIYHNPIHGIFQAETQFFVDDLNSDKNQAFQHNGADDYVRKLS